jgi:hypothetical protein
MSTDPLVRSADARQQRVSALFAADSGHVDLDALVQARSLDGSGRGAAPGLNRRFAVATVQQVVQANRREQVAALWASHDVVAAASAPDDSWRQAREAAAERQRVRQAHLASAREEEERLQQEEDVAAQRAHLQGGCGGASDVVLPVLKRGRGGVGAEALSEESGGSGSSKRRVKDAKRKSKKSKKSKSRKDGKERKHSRSP